MEPTTGLPNNLICQNSPKVICLFSLFCISNPISPTKIATTMCFFLTKLFTSDEWLNFLSQATISACETSRHWMVALDIFDLCQAGRVEETLILYNTAISACEKGGYWQFALHLLEALELKNSFQGSVITYNSAMSACAKGARWQQALLLFVQLRQRHVGTLVTYCVAMASYAAGVQWLQAIDLLGWLKQSPCHSLVASSIAVTACEEGSCFHLRTALRTLEQRLDTFFQNFRKKTSAKGGTKTTKGVYTFIPYSNLNIKYQKIKHIIWGKTKNIYFIFLKFPNLIYNLII